MVEQVNIKNVPDRLMERFRERMKKDCTKMSPIIVRLIEGYCDSRDYEENEGRIVRGDQEGDDLK